MRAGEGWCLFADAVASWASHVDIVERVVGLAEAMDWTHGAKAARRSATRLAVGASAEVRVADRVKRLADDAGVRAYETLCDRPKAVQIMERRLMVDWTAEPASAATR